MGEGIRFSMGIANGQYVWKKYGGVTLELTQLNINSNPTNIKIDAQGIDLSTVGADFFVGKTFTDNFGTMEIISETQLRLVTTSATTYSYSWTPETRILAVSASWSSPHIFDKLMIPESYKDVYVVSGNPNAYPQKGFQNGRYYELIADLDGSIVSLLRFFNIKKFETGSILFAADTSSNRTFTHNLGEKPRLFIAYADERTFDYTPPSPLYAKMYNAFYYRSEPNARIEKALGKDKYAIGYYSSVVNSAGIGNSGTIELQPTYFRWAEQLNGYYANFVGGCEYKYIIGA